MKNHPNKHNAFSLLEVLIASAILSIIGLLIATLIGDTNKSYKSTEIDQAVTIFTSNLRKALTNTNDCTVSLQAAGALTSMTNVVSIQNSSIPGLCGAVTCNITNTTSETAKFRVNRMFLTDYNNTISNNGCDLAHVGNCADITLNIEFVKTIPGTPAGGNLLRTIPITVRTTPGHVVSYCYSVLDKSADLPNTYVKVAGDTMSGTLTNTYAGGAAINLTSSYMIANYYLEHSDQNLKHNIHAIQDSEKILKQLNGVEFNWNSNNKKDWGFIAQNVESIAPHLVITDPETNLKSVKYSGVIPVLVEVAKKIEAENIALEMKINTLNSRLKSLKNQKHSIHKASGE